MCAINGHTKFMDNELIHKMNSVNQYRGPDASGVWCGSYVHLGHNLLTISGETQSSKQPWITRKGNVLCYNGEVYDTEGFDTAWLAEMLDFYGINFLRKINGHFSLAWYDTSEDILYLVRDHYGSKPLFYHIDTDGFLYFSSTLDSLETVTTLKIDTKRTDAMHAYSRHIPGRMTPYKNVHKLFPGEILRWDAKKQIQLKSHHLHDYQLENKNYTDSEIKKIIETGVRAVCDTKQKLAVSLSGGLDSNTVLSQVKKINHTNRVAVSTVYEIPQGKEIYTPYIIDTEKTKECADYHDTLHVPVVITEKVYNENKIKVLEALNHPTMDFKRTIPRYLSMKTAASVGAKVVVTGDGGDEIFTGYSGDDPSYNNRRVKIFKKDKILNDDYWQEKHPWFPLECFGDDPLNNQRLFFLLIRDSYHIVNDLCAGYFSMEYRAPFTHQELVRQILSVPGEKKLKQHESVSKPGISKYLIRGLFEEELPDTVIHQDSKAGWCIPWESRDDRENQQSFYKMVDIFNYKERNQLDKLVYV